MTKKAGDKPTEGLNLALAAKAALAEKKGADIVILDVREISSVTNYFLVATGNSSPHIKALFREVERSLKELGAPCFRRSGKPESGWMVADYLDMVVHIFSADARSYYALEDLWNDARKVE